MLVGLVAYLLLTTMDIKSSAMVDYA